MKRDDQRTPALYLLDTNILSEVIKHPSGETATRLKMLPHESIVTSVVVSCELMFGAEKKGSATLKQRVNALLRAIVVLPLAGPEFSEVYSKTRVAMEKKGDVISAHDLLIACQALSVNATVVTRNIREFSRVPGLRVQSWS